MSIAFSVIAILISGGSLWFAVKSFNKSHSIEKRQLEITENQEAEKAAEKTKARLFASIETQTIQSANLRRQALKDVLVIRNEGQCEARNITVLMDSMLIMEHPAIPNGSTEIKYVGANSTAGYDLALSMQTSPPFEIEITWEDDSGEEGNYHTTLTS